MKKGFTVIELLAVIVVLSVLVFITTPIISGVVNTIRYKAFQGSVDGVIRTIEDDVNNIDYDIANYRLFNGVIRNNNRVIEHKGTLPGEGTILVNTDGDIKLGIKYNNYCAIKDYTDNTITYTESASCDIPIIPSIIDYSWLESLTLNTTITNAMMSSFAYTPTLYGLYNRPVTDVNPWGKTDIMWKAENDAASTTDGGMYYGLNNNTHIPVNNKQNYRFSVWVKNVATTGSMQVHHTSTYSSQTSAIETITYTDGTSGGTVSSISTSNTNEWFLLVGYLYQYGSVYDNVPPTSVYRTNGAVVATTRPRKMNPTTLYALFRTPRFSSTDGYGYFYRPRMDLIDGNEPTITDLLNGQENSNIYNN